MSSETIKEKFLGKFKLAIEAGKATAKPPLSSALGQRGMAIMDFVKAFNDQTKVAPYIAGAPYTCTIFFYEKKKFRFTLHLAPTTSYLIRESFKQKGVDLSQFIKNDKKLPLPQLTWEQLTSVTEKKIVDLNVNDFRSGLQVILAVCQSFHSIGYEKGLKEKVDAFPRGTVSAKSIAGGA
jgi:large subunit ribosomal protein L11